LELIGPSDFINEYKYIDNYPRGNECAGVSRYTTSTFPRMKLGCALKKRDVAPYIFESSEEAKRPLGRE